VNGPSQGLQGESLNIERVRNVMRATDLLPQRMKGPEADVRKAVLLGVGAVAVGGTLWWAWNRSKSHRNEAPGWPGTTPHWNFAAKDGVGTALDSSGRPGGRVWFTLRRGACTEIFHPRADTPAVRDLGFVISNGRGWVSDEVRDADHETAWMAEGVPGYRLVNTCRRGRYRIEKTICTHPRRDVLLQLNRFDPLDGRLEDYRLFARVSPHLGNRGGNNTAWVGWHKGVPMLFADRDGHSLALACSVPWARSSAGFVGSVSDGYRELNRRGRLVRRYDRAEDGNVVLTGEVDLRASGGQFVLVLGFGASPAEAAHCARASLLEDFAAIQGEYVRNWQDWQATVTSLEPPEPGGCDLYRTSTAILRAHEDHGTSGAVVASLSIPWGQARTDAKTGLVGYHAVWPRDMVEVAGGLLAAGAREDCLRIFRYLQATQDDDGHWAQNQWVDGTQTWNSIQVGETALPLLLLEQLGRESALGPGDLGSYWPMVRAAAAYIVQVGPSSLEDRWENARGFTPYTLSVLIAALLVAAEMADAQGEPTAASYLRESADAWNDNLEFWTYVEDTELARQIGVRGYYLRVAPPDDHGEPEKYHWKPEFWSRSTSAKDQPPALVVSPDALAYVRFGLRAPDNPRIVDTVKVIDALLKVETPVGPAWHRYNHDGYGESRDGSPFDGHRGIGRAWPLLTGERAHYELAAGRRHEAIRLQHAMEAFAGKGGFFPEQVWDSADIPERDLCLGRPTGSAMPLAWAHAEYIKLRRSLRDGRVFDTPPQTTRRYLVDRVRSPFAIWRTDHRRRAIPAGKTLRIEVLRSVVVRWWGGDGTDGHPVPTRDTGLGVHVADLPTARLSPGSQVRFTFFRPDGGRLEMKTFPNVESSIVRIE
jgi:glucoamylase